MPLITAAMLIILLSGCSSTETILVGGKKIEIPEWVRDPDAMSGKEGIYYGVGSAKVDIIDIARYQADQLAIRDLIKGIDQRDKIDGEIIDSTGAGSANRNSDDKTHYESRGIIQGVRIVKRFVAKDGTWYSMAMLDTNQADSSYKSELNTPEIQAK